MADIAKKLGYKPTVIDPSVAAWGGTLAGGGAVVPSVAAWGAAPAGGGAVVPPRSLSEDFNAIGPDQNNYLQMARSAFYDQPAINPDTPDGSRITPAQYLRNEIARRNQQNNVKMSPEAVERALDNVFSHMTGQRGGNETVVNLSRLALKRLKGESPAGNLPTKAFAGQTLAQRADRRRDNFQDGRFITSPGLDTQLETLRAYTLLGAMEEDPELALPMFNQSGQIQSLAALPYAIGNPMNWGTNDPTVDAGAGIRHLIGLRNGTAIFDPVGARRKEVEYWTNQGARGRQEGQYKSSAEGGYYWPYSFMTAEGMAGQTENDWANALTSIDKNKDLTLSDFGMWGGEEGARLIHLGNQINREVPIVPEGSTPEETEQMRELFRKLTTQTEQRTIDEWPLMQEKYNSYVPDAMKVKEYSFPSPAMNSLVTAPKYSVDLMTGITMGPALLGGIGNASIGGIRKAGIKGMADFAKSAGKMYGADLALDQATMEQPYSMALYSANNDGDVSDYFSPIEASNVGVAPGRAGDGKYRAAFDDFKASQRAETINTLLDFQQKRFPRTQLDVEPKMRRQ